MRAVIQAVSSASVRVDGSEPRAIGPGLVILLGVRDTDSLDIVPKLAEKCAGLRIFKDENDKLNLSAKDLGYSALVVSQFTLYVDDIRSAFENNYIGINNSYDNKVMFVAAINQYFDGLVREGVLYGDAENTADIDVNAQRDWLAQKYDISEYSDEQIRKAKTGSYVFVTADVTFCDAIEDLKFSINME